MPAQTDESKLSMSKVRSGLWRSWMKHAEQLQRCCGRELLRVTTRVNLVGSTSGTKHCPDIGSGLIKCTAGLEDCIDMDNFTANTSGLTGLADESTDCNTSMFCECTWCRLVLATRRPCRDKIDLGHCSHKSWFFCGSSWSLSASWKKAHGQNPATYVLYVNSMKGQPMPLCDPLP